MRFLSESSLWLVRLYSSDARVSKIVTAALRPYEILGAQMQMHRFANVSPALRSGAILCQRLFLNRYLYRLVFPPENLGYHPSDNNRVIKTDN
jgi:hypothetical protein